MIAHTNTGSSFQGILSYCLEREEAEVLYQEGVSGTVSDMGFYIDMFAEQRTDLSKTVYHTSLSFDYQDQLSNEQMIEIAQNYLKKFGFKNNQYAIIRHSDTSHCHIHIVANVTAP
jgi:hypothetical protein